MHLDPSMDPSAGSERSLCMDQSLDWSRESEY